MLGHAHRLALLEHVAQGERPVERLAALAGLSSANASQHLHHLHRCGLVISRRHGKQVLYRLGDGPILALLAALRRVAEHNLADMRELVRDSFDRLDALEPVSREELARRIRAGSVTVLDVRPAEEFALGHLPGALNLPFCELERHLGELPTEADIVAYCRGPYCVMAFEAVAALRSRGYAAERLEDGFPEWKAAGLPVESAAPPS